MHGALRARDTGPRGDPPRERTGERRLTEEGLVGRSPACPHPGGGHPQDLVVGSWSPPPRHGVKPRARGGASGGAGVRACGCA